MYETNTYAARKQSSEQFGKDFYYGFTANSSKFYKSYINDIYNAGLDGLEKQGDKYYYHGKEVPTIEDFKTIYVPRTDGSEGLGEYPADKSNKYYINGTYTVPTTYYDVLSDFLIAHPDSPIFAGKAKEVFWGDGEEEYYFNIAFVARLLNNSFKSKYNLNIDTQNFSNKQLDSKVEDSRPTENKTYSFVRTDLKGDADSYLTSIYGSDDEMWKHEIGSSYSPENVEKVRRWVKGYKSMNGSTVTDPFGDKPTSEITQQEYIDAVFNNVFNFYLSTYKDQLTPEEIKELRAKLGDSVFNIVGSIVGPDIENPETYVFYGGGSQVFRNSLGVVTENTESFTYHDVITPLRAYRLTADNNLVRHIYEQVKRGSVVATHKDTEGNELLPQESIKTNEYDGEAYTTSSKKIPNKVVTDKTPEGFTRTTTTTYTLVENPANKDGNVVGGETITVPYVYRPTNDVRINGSVIATYSTEDGEKLTDDVAVKTDAPEQEAYTTSAKEFESKTETSDVNGLTKTTVTRYELIENPSNKDGNVIGNKVITVPYVYRKVVTVELDGGVIATHKDTDGNELSPTEIIKSHSPEGDDYTTAPKTFDPIVTTDTVDGLTRTTTTTYELVETPTNANGQVKGGETIKVPYVYKKIVKQEINGSVIVTHHDENGVQLALDEKIKNNVKAGEPYTSSPKQFDSSITTNHVNGLTQTTYAHYELSRIPSNDQGEVVGGETTIVPYIYRRVERIVTNGSVVATYKDTDGNELAPQVDVKTNVEPGQVYDTEVKRFPIQTLSESKPTDDVVKVTVTEYKLVKIPENKSGEVKDGQVIVVPYVYEKVVSVHYEKKDTPKPQFEIPKDSPKVEKEEYKLTRFMLEDRKTEINPWVEGFVKPIQTIGNYVYTGATDSDEGGAVITHIYKLVEFEVPNVSELPKDSPVHDKPEFNGGVIPNDAPVHDKPEYNGSVVPNDSPVHDKPEFNGGVVPNDPPVHDKPEFNGGVVPNDPPVHDKPEFNGGVVPNDSPVHDKPKLDIPTPNTPTPELPKPEVPSVETPKPSQPLEQKPQEKYVTKELPNTGSESSALGLLGFAGVIGSLLLLKKQKED